MAIDRNKNSQSPTRRRKSKYSIRTIFMIGLFALVMISFVLSSMPISIINGFFNKTKSNGVVENLASAPVATVSPSAQSSVAFKKEGELRIVRKGRHEILLLNIEVAMTPDERSQGLMHRKYMEADNGMLFIMEKEEEQRFYMKNTYIPLDIIYMNKQREIISIQKNTTPLSEQSLPSNGDAIYVLEVNAGYTDMNGVKEGDRVVFTLMQ